MYILHLSLLQGIPYLWAEKAFSEIPIQPKKKGRQPLNPPPKIHPYAANDQELIEELSEYLKKKNLEKCLIWLPTLLGAPVPSNPILGSFEMPKEQPRLQPWAIWACPIEYNVLIRMLLDHSEKEQLKPSVHFGKEFRYFSQLLHFAISLTIRERFLPALKGENATWEPAFLGDDKNRIHQFETRLPTICRAISNSLKNHTSPQYPAKLHLITFIGKVIDSLVREANQEIKIKSETSHDAFLKGLVDKKNTLKLKENDRAMLSSAIKEWKKPIHNVSTSPFKFCMRLEEPNATTVIQDGLSKADSPWSVSYLLQAYDDLSLFVKTEDAWNPKGVKKNIIERSNFHPRQFILSLLGIAVNICPKVESSLESPIPTGFNINSKEAHEFLQEQAAALEEAGFGVICPKWWKKRTPLSVKGMVEKPFDTKRNRSIWEDLQMDWQVFLGGIKLTEDELHQLALLKEPIVNMRGEWVVLDKDQIQKAIDFIKNKPLKPKTPLDFLQIAAGINEEVHGIEVTGLEAVGEIGEFFNSLQNHSTLKVLNAPSGFKGTLRPYQLRGYSWMAFLKKWQLGACLADDMGLGKTPQTLALIMQGWEETDSPKPTLLVCPTSLTGNWSREAKKFVPDLPMHVHHGGDRVKGEKFLQAIQGKGLVITSYSLLHRDEEFINQAEWASVILDEAQNIKNSTTKQSKAAFKLNTNWRVALTGTPVENNVGDLWSLMQFLNPGYLGTQDSFRRNFFTPIQVERSRKATEKLQKLTTPIILRRLKTDKSIINDLPEKLEMKVYCTLTSEQISLYETVVSDANGLLTKKEGIERKAVILSTLLKLKQICNHPVNFLSDATPLNERSGKLERLIEMLDEASSVGDKSLIFTQFSEMGTLLKKNLEEKFGREVLFLHGGVPKKCRDTMVERFQNETNGPNIFILSLKAGGVGLNLTRANHVFHFDRWWNPAVENQATDRAFRIGQKKNVQVHKFICNGTVEERIDEMIEEKKQVADRVVGSGESWLTELSTEDLKDLWTLRTNVGV